MKIAVTGASGFIGRHVLGALARESDVEIVTTSRGDVAPGATRRLFRHVLLDIASPATDAYDQLGRPDALIHLAWSGLPNYMSLHHFETELAQQYRFLCGLVRAGLPALICAGTCLEYGMQSGLLDESLRSDPQNPYGFAKDALRRQLMFLRESTGFSLTWLRLFYMYGEGQSPQSLYSQLMAAGRRGDPSFQMSTGEQLRDYLPVGDVASSVVALAMRAPNAGVVNLCSGRPTSVRSLVEGWVRENGWKIDLQLGHYPLPTYEPMAFWGCDERLKHVLNNP